MAPFARYSLAKTSRKERKLGRRLRRAYLPSCSRADACGCARVTAAGVNTTEHFTVAELVGRNARDLAHGRPKKALYADIQSPGTNECTRRRCKRVAR